MHTPEEQEKLADYERVKPWKSDPHSDVSHLFLLLLFFPLCGMTDPKGRPQLQSGEQ